MAGFTMNGDHDLDALALDLWDEGIRLGGNTLEQARANVARVLRAALLNGGLYAPRDSKPFEHADFVAACQGMVQAAEGDELI